MKKITRAILIVFSKKKYIAGGIVSALLFGLVFIFGTGMISFFPSGAYVEPNVLRITTFITLVILSGITMPMQWYAIKKAKAGIRQSASGAGGIFAGIATMSCCAPLLLPALLSFAGFSGTQLLFLNATVRQYGLYLSIASVSLLLVSLGLVSKSITNAVCKIQPIKT